MSSSLSELRNFRVNKGTASTNGANPSSKLATGRKRIRAISDSSDDEHAKKQVTPEKPTQNGTTAVTLTTKDKEERFHLLREIVEQSVDSLTLQDFLVRSDWDVQKAYDTLQESPKFKNSVKHSTSEIKQSPSVSTNHLPSVSANHSLNESVEVVKEKKRQQNKVKSIIIFKVLREN